MCSSSIDVVSGVPQCSVLGPLLFLLYIVDLPRLLQNELVGYADDSTLLRRIPHPRNRLSVAASLNDDLAVISDWCSRWSMLVNPSKGPHPRQRFQSQPRCAARSRLRLQLMVYPHTQRPICSILAF